MQDELSSIQWFGQFLLANSSFPMQALVAHGLPFESMQY
jgi:hypothetical protein